MLVFKSLTLKFLSFVSTLSVQGEKIERESKTNRERIRERGTERGGGDKQRGREREREGGGIGKERETEREREKG